MDEYEPLYSEEDVRTKVVTAWLADHSFGPSDIFVEYSFEIQLGRKILPIGSEKCDRALSQVFRSRAGILVRSCGGRNLLIVEVKAPDEPLDENAREQGICYAHLLRKGGIAPFVVLTNGRETKIYDGISEELINDRTIPLSRSRVKAGFLVRAEALQGELEALARDSELRLHLLEKVLRESDEHPINDLMNRKAIFVMGHPEAQAAVLTLTSERYKNR